MEEEPYDPRELFADVALLITEARTPDLSKKGRVEGPHCPPILGSKEHDCDRHKEQVTFLSALQIWGDQNCNKVVHNCHTFLSAQYLLNQRLDSYQICMDI